MNIRWIRNALLVSVLVGVGLAVGCGGSGPEGKYRDDDGAVTLELKGGKADMAVGPEHINGTYTADSDKVTIHPTEGDTSQAVVFSRNKDGSLDAPQGSGFPRLQKAK